jgi:hypothetical protein
MISSIFYFIVWSLLTIVGAIVGTCRSGEPPSVSLTCSQFTDLLGSTSTFGEVGLLYLLSMCCERSSSQVIRLPDGGPRFIWRILNSILLTRLPYADRSLSALLQASVDRGLLLKNDIPVSLKPRTHSLAADPILEWRVFCFLSEGSLEARAVEWRD